MGPREGGAVTLIGVLAKRLLLSLITLWLLSVIVFAGGQLLPGDVGRAILGPLATDLEAADRPPTGPQREVFAQYRQKAQTGLEHWKALVDGPLRDFDKRVRAAGGKLAPVL